MRDRLAIHQFEDEELRRAGFVETVDRGDVRVVEGGEYLRFTAEPRDPLRIVREGRG